MEKVKPVNSSIKNVIGVLSGKGGVGKSSITALLAVELNKRGYKVGVLDGDLTGPSIPKIFGLGAKRPEGSEEGLIPVTAVTGIKIMSINLLIDDEASPVVWRGPLLSNTVKQFYTDVIWGDLDYLLIDLPPGTGDIPLTVMQTFPLDGIVIVSSPQELVKLIVKKSLNMAKMLDIQVLGVVENMSYIECPECGKKINLFGKSKIDSIASEMGVEVLGKLPVDPDLAELSDSGRVELYGVSNDYMKEVADKIVRKREGTRI